MIQVVYILASSQYEQVGSSRRSKNWHGPQITLLSDVALEYLK